MNRTSIHWLHAIKLVWLTCAMCLSIQSIAADTFDHAEWDALLKSHVVEISGGKATRVKYAEFKKSPAALKAYLDKTAKVSEAQFASWSKPDQLAFLINVYNAQTVELILTKYPDIKSIKELGSVFSSPWKKAFIPLLGKTVSLDNIEHDMIRAEGRYNDPRIHFAVVCASIGCPALRNEAFVGSKIDQQLDDNAARFLSDRSRNRFNSQEGVVEVSKIFNWYEKDFTKGWKGYQSLAQFLAKYAKQLSDNPADQQKIASGQFKVDYLDYDWSLNDAAR